MLKAVGAASLDALIDEAIPARIRLEQPLEPARRRERVPVPPRTAADGLAQPAVPIVHRSRLLRLHHAERHPAQRPREPRLVHAVHAVSGRDRAGPPRSAPQFPDDGPRPDGDGSRQRVAARRGDRRRRGDDDAGARAGEADRRRGGRAAVSRRRLVLSRRRSTSLRGARRAARHRASSSCRPRTEHGGVRRPRLRRAGADAGRSRTRPRPARVHRAREAGGRARRGRHRSAEPACC